MYHTELEASNLAGYSESIFEEVEYTVEWAKEHFPNGDSAVISEALLSEFPVKDIRGNTPGDVIELSRIAWHMGMVGLNFNDYNAHDFVYGRDFHERIGYHPEF